MANTGLEDETAFSSAGTTRRGIAGRLADLVREQLGRELPVGLRLWDGSRSGPADGPVVVIRSSRAVRYLMCGRAELGLARAYVAGDLDVDGDLQEGLRRCLSFVREVRDHEFDLTRVQWPRVLSLAARLGALGLPPRRPPGEARLSGRRHSSTRDRAAIAHHYDVGNDFYAAVLDPTMSYSCGYWMSEAPDYDLADAQRDKLDLICRKLGLTRGDTLLDVGCGWGALIIHAAERFGVQTTGVTNSGSQYTFVRERLTSRDLTRTVTVVNQDYRRPTGAGPYDAVASIEMGEHVGDENFPAYCSMLHTALKPGGRLLLQQMSRGEKAPGGGAFIERYIAPDMTMRPIPRTLRFLEEAGFEIREVVSLREHYTATINAWLRRLEDGWDDVVYRHGARRARVWRLYLAGGALAFEQNRMSVHQILAVRTGPDGDSGIAPVGDRSGVSWNMHQGVSP
ncbi:class I SAM-dependent methyltransferase [Actinomadura scrupuli]|uniref:class I SAM-dependent methyltransferase n=1 Tax=Actinomadura scrupuli TaxID=559629 RepID=UPI003D96DAA3